MSEQPGTDSEAFGSELRKRQSPAFAREQRRRNLAAALFGALMGLVSMLSGIDAMRTGSMVHLGPRNGVLIPAWLAALLGVFVLFIAGLILWRNVFRRG